MFQVRKVVALRIVSQIRDWASMRARLARRHLRGSGIEIGALHSPTRLPRGASVKYVDHLAGSELATHYPELDSSSFVQVDIVDNAEKLELVPDKTQDFVVASHVLEHCEDPIGALKSWLRVLREGGVALLAVPNKESSFDSARDVTTWDHLLQDHEAGPAWSRRGHYLEWASLVAGETEDLALEHALDLESNRYSIHFHVWDWRSFQEFVERCQGTLESIFVVEEIIESKAEFLLVLRKCARST